MVRLILTRNLQSVLLTFEYFQAGSSAHQLLFRSVELSSRFSTNRRRGVEHFRELQDERISHC